MITEVIYQGKTFNLPIKNDEINHFSHVTAMEIKRGKLKKEPCEICGNEKSIGHHEVYDDIDYKIRWLCRKHHSIIHALFDKVNGVYARRAERNKLIDQMVRKEMLISEALKNYE